MLLCTHLGSDPWDLRWAWRGWFSPGGVGAHVVLGGWYRKDLGTEGEFSPSGREQTGEKSRTLEMRERDSQHLKGGPVGSQV